VVASVSKICNRLCFDISKFLSFLYRNILPAVLHIETKVDARICRKPLINLPFDCLAVSSHISRRIDEFRWQCLLEESRSLEFSDVGFAGANTDNAYDRILSISATRGVCNQVTLVTSDANRANMRLHHASQYLSQFSLEVHHIPGKTNIAPDALSRLSAFEPKDVSQYNTLDGIYVMSEAYRTEEFRERLTSGYAKDPHFQRKLRLLGCGDGKLPESCVRPGVSFFIENGLLYNTIMKGQDRLCIT
jgi:hypothetical protein